MVQSETKHVLLVEDEKATRDVIARHLRRSGLDVVAVESGEAALVEASRAGAGFAVVVSDVHLPGMSGLDLVSLILSRCASQPVVLITGDPDAALARAALARGPVSYLLKPFEMFELDAAVNQALVRQDMSQVWGGSAMTGMAGSVPQNWLDLVDSRSYAGPGHAQRVGHIALALAEVSPTHRKRIDEGELLVAAWSHELGRLSTETWDPAAMAVEGGRLLAELGCAAGVVEGVRHMHERWDGSGGPERRAGEDIPLITQLLSVADSIDHYVSAWLQAGKDATEAVDRALGLVRVQSGSVFCPAAVEAALLQRPRIMSICGRPAAGGVGGAPSGAPLSQVSQVSHGTHAVPSARDAGSGVTAAA
jgi:putative two-component system response regulator